ncbi:MAG: creatininase family protein [Verrucomicrobia bacterium]|nr:creatininase family protein [Verrucomicrobiota bacterium]
MKANHSDVFFPVMEHMTVKEVRDYLQRKQSIILPIGVTEQHGYHLPLETDSLIARNLGKMIGVKTDILVAPVMQASFSGGGCPGTINISPAVMSLVVRDTLLSLFAQGFRNFYLFPCHGGSENMRALEDALRLLLRMNPDFDEALIALMPVWKFDPECIGWNKAMKENDWHAGWLETSMVMALEPGKVRMDQLTMDAEPLRSLMIEHPDNYQQAEKIVDDKFVVPRLTQRPDVKVGVMGFPERANREAGVKIVESIVNAVAEKIMDIESRADGIYKEIEFKPEPLIL